MLFKSNEAQSEMQRARDAIARLQSYIAAPGQIERDIAALDSAEAELIAKWSTSGGAFPTLDADRRHGLEEALSEARNKAAGAQRAIPSLEASLTQATNAANAVTLKINAAVAEIVLEEAMPGLVEIAAMRQEIAERQEIAAAARELSLRLVEAIPLSNRVEIGAGYFRAADQWEAARVAAVSTPSPSRERCTIWARLVAALKTDATAQVDHQAEAE